MALLAFNNRLHQFGHVLVFGFDSKVILSGQVACPFSITIVAHIIPVGRKHQYRIQETLKINLKVTIYSKGLGIYREYIFALLLSTSNRLMGIVYRWTYFAIESELGSHLSVSGINSI